MKILWLIVIFPLFLTAKDFSDTLQFLAGDYLLIGKKPNSSNTYSGTISFVYKEEKNELEFTRMINGKKTKGIAKIEKTLSGESEVLRLRFIENKSEYEGTFLWRSDLDNYGRLSGYIYPKNGSINNPGLEAYFIKQ